MLAWSWLGLVRLQRRALAKKKIRIQAQEFLPIKNLA